MSTINFTLTVTDHFKILPDPNQTRVTGSLISSFDLDICSTGNWFLIKLKIVHFWLILKFSHGTAGFNLSLTCLLMLMHNMAPIKQLLKHHNPPSPSVKESCWFTVLHNTKVLLRFMIRITVFYRKFAFGTIRWGIKTTTKSWLKKWKHGTCWVAYSFCINPSHNVSIYTAVVN